MPTNDSEATSAVPAESSTTQHVKPQLSTDPSFRTHGWNKFKSLDGDSRFYTLTVLTTLAFTIATVYFDIGFLETDEHDEVFLEEAVSFHTLSAAGRQIVRALLLLVLCLFIGAYSFMLLSINVYKFEKDELIRHRLWLILSFISAIVSNVLVITIMVTSQLKYREREEDEDNYESEFSHYLLFSVLFLSTLAMDFYFLDAFHTSYQVMLLNEREEAKERKGWGFFQKAGIQSRIQKMNAEQPDRPLETQPTMRSRVSKSAVAVFIWMLQRLAKGTNAIVCAARWLLGVQREVASNSPVISLKYATEDVSDFFLDITDKIERSFAFQMVHRIASFLTWDIWNPARTVVQRRQSDNEEEEPGMGERSVQQMALFWCDTVQYWRNFGEGFRSGVETLYKDIREEDEKFQHSSWVLAAMITAFVLLLYFGVGVATYTSNFLNERYIPRRNCAIWTIEKNGELGNFVFRLAGFTDGSSNAGQAFISYDEETFTEAACEVDLPSDIQGADFEEVTRSFDSSSLPDDLENRTSDFDFDSIAASANSGALGVVLEDARYFRCSSESYTENSCTTLLLINQLEQNTSATLNETKTPREVFRDQSIGKTIYVVDQMLRHLRWSIWIGLMAGIIVGIYSLLSVLAQYKRISLAIRSGFFKGLELSEDLTIQPDQERDAHVQRIADIVTERNWKELIVRYPMGASVFFFGILVSTAVIQLVLFGGLVSLLLSLIASIFDRRVFGILRPFLAFLIAFLITWLLNGPLAQMVLSEGILVKRYHIFHELSFLLFLLVYTAVHLVLGVFFALMRLVWVLLTTIACLNRLDRNLFPILQQNDLGHKSFMSMVLMQHAFRQNATKGSLTRLRETRQFERPVTSPDGSQPDIPKFQAIAKAMMQGKRTTDGHQEISDSNVVHLNDEVVDNDRHRTSSANSPPSHLPIV